MIKEDNDKGLRFNEGKIRMDLVPAFAQEQYAKVLTKGAEKYADWNWAKGMKWTKVLASLERHLQEIKAGRDIDPESGLYHSAHIMCNAAFLTEYYKIYPQGDDRPHHYLQQPKIGLDLDDVCVSFIPEFAKRFNLPEPTSWSWFYDSKKYFDEVANDKDFWLNLPAKIDPKTIPFEPHAYLTSRSIPVEWSQTWLETHGFPARKVYSVPFNTSKVAVAIESGIDIMVDDRYDNFIELNKNGICCFLFDCNHNRRYDVGYKRIFNLNELVHKK